MDEEIEVGDHVTVGNGKVHWIVTMIYGDDYPGVVSLKSGQTGMHRYAQMEELTLHTKGVK